MKILLCHNFYQQPGGEYQVFEDEAWLLESRGHEVIRFTRHNDNIPTIGRWDLARRTIWSDEAYRELRALIRRERPDVMHCTNTFPLISPAAYHAARREGVAVVQSLHNYRILCPGANLLRDGKPCEDCIGRRFAWPGVVHACYKDSRTASAAAAAMSSVHWFRGTWTKAVNRYIALTEFARHKFIQGGLPADRICVKPNFVHPDPQAGEGRGGYALFAGRLSTEKGIETLLAAWRKLGTAVPLKIIGDGPLAKKVEDAARRCAAIEWLGRQSVEFVLQQLGDARCLIVPSICYETFGRTTIEAFARGTPVVASRIGAQQELVEDGHTGRLFTPGDASALAHSVSELIADEAALHHMRDEARHQYERFYTAEHNYEQLMNVYRDAVRHCHGRADNAVLPEPLGVSP